MKLYYMPKTIPWFWQINQSSIIYTVLVYDKYTWKKFDQIRIMEIKCKETKGGELHLQTNNGHLIPNLVGTRF